MYSRVVHEAMAAGENGIQGAWPPELTCGCDLLTSRHKMTSGRNKNRWFYKCCNWQGPANACLVWIWEDLLDDYAAQYCRFMVMEAKKYMTMTDVERKQKEKAERVWKTAEKSRSKAKAVAMMMQGISAMAVIGCSMAALKHLKN